jgi:hypothetical protein
MRQRILAHALVILLTGSLVACSGMPQLGQGGSMVSGSAGEGGAQGASTSLARCDSPLGTAALVEPEAEAITALGNVGLHSPTPLLRLMMAQSQCFRVIDRGAALGSLNTEQ